MAAGRNLGMRKGEARTIISIDNDAIFSSEHALLEAADLFAEKPELGAVSFRIDNYGTGELDVNSWVFPKKLLERRNSGFLTTRFTGGGNAIRREAFQATKGYDERLFFYWEELDLAYQMIAEGYTILYEPSIVVRHKTVAEGGVNWKQERFYFLVRNALYLDWKYFKSYGRLLALATGYLAKGLYNGVVFQVYRGIRDSLGMMKSLGSDEKSKLTARALEYIQLNDLRYRGNLWERVNHEVLTPLPGSRRNG